ncbi:hypothetical protein E2C01_014521 [Portunus trituberculatus]|uniref:Uncharacterized protein n=1 Tax=Portunus trituberculatus TaxID=210409 RepID=A0A5B7DK83_PORTR|nr:hypothetical protein [Portunus trituberculatus]
MLGRTTLTSVTPGPITLTGFTTTSSPSHHQLTSWSVALLHWPSLNINTFSTVGCCHVYSGDYLVIFYSFRNLCGD